MRTPKRNIRKFMRRRRYEDLMVNQKYEALSKRLGRERYLIMTDSFWCCIVCARIGRWKDGTNSKRKGKRQADLRREARSFLDSMGRGVGIGRKAAALIGTAAT